jgi:arsenate reductase-like glutaredoxin family protein
LSAAAITAREVVDARKNPVASSDIEMVLGKIKHVSVARGKAYSSATLSDLRQDEKAFHKMFGPTGNLRAPAIIVGDKLAVGFNQEMYENIFND